MGEASAVRRKVGLANALRGLARDRAGLTVLMAGGSPEVRISGVIDSVGRDFFDLAMRLPGEPRRAGHVADVATIPFRRVGCPSLDCGRGALSGKTGPARDQTGLGLGLLDHAAGLRIALFDVLLEHLFFDAPLAAAAHLDGLQFAAADQAHRLPAIDLELLGYVCKR